MCKNSAVKILLSHQIKAQITAGDWVKRSFNLTFTDKKIFKHLLAKQTEKSDHKSVITELNNLL